MSRRKKYLSALLIGAIFILFCFVGLRQQSAKSLEFSDFNKEFIKIERLSDSRYRITNTFELADIELEYGWYIYEDLDKETYSYKQDYSVENEFIFEAPEDDKIYQVKAFVIGGGQKATAWSSQFYVEEGALEEAPFPDFTKESVKCTAVSDNVYKFENQYKMDGAETGYKIYRLSDAGKTLEDTVTGSLLEYNYQPNDDNYIIEAYIKRGDKEKSITVRKLYGNKLLDLMKSKLTIEDEEIVDEILEGNFNGLDVSLPIDWNLPSIESRTEKGAIYAWRFLDPLYAKFFETGDEIYKERILEYTDSWLVQDKGYEESETDSKWNDFSVSRRLRFMCMAKIFFENDMSDGMKDRLEICAGEYAKLLSTDSFYKWKHNHGMYQDMSLLYYCVAYGNEDAQTDYYYELAKNRAGQYFAYAISSDGVHLEHSPNYHPDVAFAVGWFADFYRLYKSDYVEAEELDSLEVGMENFYYDLYMPNFKWPSIGDSYSTPISQARWADDPRYIFMQSKGEEGESPKETMRVYPEGGYAFMRSSWEDAADEGTYILLTAATHSKAHKQQDDLNFIIYHKGDFITEGGKRNFDYLNEETQYTYSSYAHNVLFVDKEGWPLSEKGLPIIDDAAYETHITDFSDGENIQSVTAISKRWPTVEQRRTITYHKSEDYIEVKDELSASQEEEVRLIFHIAEGITVEENENGWSCTRGEIPIADIEVISSNEAKLSKISGGEEDGKFKTWIFGEGTERREGSLLIVDMVCEKGENEIKLKMELK